mgnify:CR=1 FL=1
MTTVSTIEGIGDATATKLKNVGIGSTEELLEVCGDPKGRARIAKEARMDEKKLLRLVNHADLMRIDGIGGEFSELLEAAGVDSVPELAQRNAENLAAKMEEVNAAKKLVRRVPSAKQVTGWIEEAKGLDRKVTH